MRTLNKKISRSEKNKLKRICLILFPEYKRVRITRRNSTVLSKRTVTTVKRREIFEYNYLMDYMIPLKLSLFKYNNEQFIAEVFNQRMKSTLAGETQINFYYNQILKLKLSDEIDEEIIVVSNTSFCSEDEHGNKTFYYILNDHLHTVKDVVLGIRENIYNFFKPFYYETVGTIIVLIAFFVTKTI